MSPDKAGRIFIALGALNGAAAVLLGAAGAHLFRARLTLESMRVFETALLFQFVHALGLILVGVIAAQRPGSRAIRFSGWLMLAGLLLFSGSLYCHVLGGLPAMRRLTPWGGISFALAWLTLAAGAWAKPGGAS